jgi:hypothetical protein
VPLKVLVLHLGKFVNGLNFSILYCLKFRNFIIRKDIAIYQFKDFGSSNHLHSSLAGQYFFQLHLFTQRTPEMGMAL